VGFSSESLADGAYRAFLIISNNDPDEDPLVVPVTMQVGHVFVTSPGPLDTLRAGQQEEVTWTTYLPVAVDSVSILYSTNGGRDFTQVAHGEPNDFSFTWSVPSTPSDSCKVRVVAYYEGGGEYDGLSAGQFVIVGSSGIAVAGVRL